MRLKVASLIPIFSILLLLSVTYGCDKLEQDNIDEDLSYNSELEIQGIYNMIQKAKYISGFSWTPVRNLSIGYANFPANHTISGIPYSSVKELDTYVGSHVSFYTFYTAINNPRSVMYTENISQPPYHGTNCATYYGTVCSSTVEYALGIDIAYGTSKYETLPLFKKKQNNYPEYTEIGDVLLKKGHVSLVVNVIKDKYGNINSVDILESVITGTSINRYTYSSFTARWKSDNISAYYFTDFEHNDLGMDECRQYNTKKKICPNKGDNSNYLISDSIYVNVLSDKISEVKLFKDGTELGKYAVNEGKEDILLKGLESGCYQAVAADISGSEIDECNFNVVEADVEVEKVDADRIKVTFNGKNATPYIIRLCSESGGGYVFDILSSSDISSGSKIVSLPDVTSDIYCKVLFKNSFGQIQSTPILLD